MTAHGDDTLGTQLLGGEHRAEAYRAVTDDCDHLARLHVGRVGAAPAGAQHIGGRQQAGDQFVGREVGAATRVPSASGTRSRGACAPPASTYWLCKHRLWKPA